MQKRVFAVAVVFSAVVAIALAVATTRPVKAPPSKYEAIVAPSKVEEQLPEAKKGDKEQPKIRIIPTVRSPVMDKPVEQPVVSLPPKAQPEPEPQPPPEPRRERRREYANVCERHGMRKVETRGGKSWRCAKKG